MIPNRQFSTNIYRFTPINAPNNSWDKNMMDNDLINNFNVHCF